MPTWYELDPEFQALSEPLRHHNLQFQWGAAGTHYQLSGGAASPASARFEALARLAGAKLRELPDGVLHESVSASLSPSERWYEAIRHHSGAFEHGFVGQEVDSAGNDLGRVYTGSIHQPASASSVLALQLSQYDRAKPQTYGRSINITQQSGVVAVGQKGNIHSPQLFHAPPPAEPRTNRKRPWWKSWWAATVGITGVIGAIATVLQWLQIGPHAPASPPTPSSVEVQSYNDDLHIFGFRHGPFEAGKGVNVNLYFRYTGSAPAHARSPFGVDLIPLTPEEQHDTAKIQGLVESMWASFTTQGFRSQSLIVPPNTERFASTWSQPLMQEQADNWNLRSTGLLIALGAMGWDDGLGAYETEYCVFVVASNPNVFVTCKEHNGPVTRRAKRYQQ
jgi:hypothetical protein